jgi:Cft2 family RNA processing exonuclease
MFHYDGGLKITAIDLAVDIPRRQARGFISHAHADHMAPHELAVCTPPTAALYRWRYGERLVRELPFGEPFAWSVLRLVTLPAGHMFGAAMLKVESAAGSLLYTGDFKLSPSRTAPAASPARADTLVMESTFGDPRYQWPPREEVEAQLVSLVRQALQVGRTPIVHAYVVGKSQEVTRILSDAGLRVLQHPLIAQVSAVYEAQGCRVGAAGTYESPATLEDAAAVLVMPPLGQRVPRPELPRERTTIAVTGWATDDHAKFRLGVDYAVPLSDHADYAELVDCVRQVQPRVVYCTHGPHEFSDRLRKLGFDARPLETAGRNR